MRYSAFDYVNGLMTVAFLFSVAVQYNDPDPLRWMAIYGGGALACVLFRRSPSLTRVSSAAVGMVAVVWATLLAPQALGKVGFGELFEAFEMKDSRVEIAREFGGLLILAVWMIVLLVASKLRWRRPKPS